MIPSLQYSEPTNKIQIISTTKVPTHLIDSQRAGFRTNPLEHFDKVNIRIKSILASRVIQPKNLANALDHHNICSRVFLFAQIRKSMITIIVALVEANLFPKREKIAIEWLYLKNTMLA